MKGLLVVGILAVLVVPLAGCVMPTGAPIAGMIYTDVTGPGYAIDSSASFFESWYIRVFGESSALPPAMPVFRKPPSPSGSPRSIMLMLIT